MDSSVDDQKKQDQTVTVEDVNRLLEVGRLLFSVLAPEEIEALQTELDKYSTCTEIGNTGDS